MTCYQARLLRSALRRVRPAGRPNSSYMISRAKARHGKPADRRRPCRTKAGKTFDCKIRLKKDGDLEPAFDSKPKGKYNKARR